MIELKNLTKRFKLNDGTLTVLNDVSLDIEAGEFIGILGASGSGKSTLVNIIGFLDRKFEGRYKFQGKPVEKYTDDALSKIRNRHVGFVFQNFHLIETMTIAQNVALPLTYAGRKAPKQVKKVLESVGLSDFANQNVKLLSGGQRQRTAIARALINNPSFIIADEPTGALDSHTSHDIMEIFATLNRERGVTIILITHDERLTAYCDRVIRISDGEVMANESF
jgi:putative ABC transport system ATP-binding protein